MPTSSSGQQQCGYVGGLCAQELLGKAHVIRILFGAELDEAIALMIVRYSVLRKVHVHCR